MVYFKTKNHNLGKFWRPLEWKVLVYFMVVGNILWPYGIFYLHWVYCTASWYILWSFGIVVVIWYIPPPFGILCQEKSGNPGYRFRFRS
jgi:hypothetical protein